MDFQGYLMDDLRPQYFRDRLLDMDVALDSFIIDFDARPRAAAPRYPASWRSLAAAVHDAAYECVKDKFQVNLDVRDFEHEEITVKISEGHIVVEGKHDEKRDEKGLVTRYFKRRYPLPEGCIPETVESTLTSDGLLTVIAPKVSVKGRRSSQITERGPTKGHDSEQEEDEKSDGEEEPEIKSPEKKRSKE